MGYTESPADCWDACSALAESSPDSSHFLVAIDWTQHDGQCFCRDDCTCREDAGDDGITLLIARDQQQHEHDEHQEDDDGADDDHHHHRRRRRRVLTADKSAPL